VITRFPEITFLQIGVDSEELIEGVIDCRTQFSLREQLSLVANSFFHLGVDSFWSHAASALDTKAIVLFGNSSPLIFGHDNNFNLYKKTECSPCFDLLDGMNCPYSRKCMSTITVDEVCKTIEFILK
jgi:ADP-heptose:LPS heptosyltransferase